MSALAGVAAEPRTTVLFEAPGRVAATLADLAGVCGGERPVSVSRELTKVHEEHWRGTLADAVTWIAAHPIRGEVALVLAGAAATPAETVSDEVLVAALRGADGRGRADQGGRGRSGLHLRGARDGASTSWRWRYGRRLRRGWTGNDVTDGGSNGPQGQGFRRPPSSRTDP